ncbi:hypothetical protein [Mycobacterium sp.]|uniref:hypothetical protein n=1 Tax=Mycobacterium sp. TaxID=1785 RepID=UPI002580BC62|nr:hypothetical protein [Mycobacterium sp.]
MTDAGGRDVEARIEEAVKRLEAHGQTLWWSLVNDLGLDFNEQYLLLSRLWDILPSKQRSVAVAAVWALSDPPETFLPTAEWLRLFRAVGYIEDTFDGNWPPPPAQIELWRGGVRETGMAWTVDRKRAEWFQHRYDHQPGSKPGKLWTATVGAEYLLAHFHVYRPGENEYVVDPAGLNPIEVH